MSSRGLRSGGGSSGTELPARSPDRGPPHWKSTILRRQALGYEDA
jgi:hypothetical protein